MTSPIGNNHSTHTQAWMTTTPGEGADRTPGSSSFNFGSHYTTVHGSSDDHQTTTDTPPLDDPDPASDGDRTSSLEGAISFCDRSPTQNIADIMALLHQVALDQKKTAKEIRHDERDSQISAIQDQADKAREAAKWAMAAGIVSGAFTMAGGIAGARGEAATSQARTGIAGGLGQMAAAPLTMQSDTLKAEGVEAQADQTKAESAAQDSTDFINNMNDVIRDVRQKVAEAIQAQNDALRSIIRA